MYIYLYLLISHVVNKIYNKHNVSYLYLSKNIYIYYHFFSRKIYCYGNQQVSFPKKDKDLTFMKHLTAMTRADQHTQLRVLSKKDFIRQIGNSARKKSKSQLYAPHNRIKLASISLFTDIKQNGMHRSI